MNTARATCDGTAGASGVGIDAVDFADDGAGTGGDPLSQPHKRQTNAVVVNNALQRIVFVSFGIISDSSCLIGTTRVG